MPSHFSLPIIDNDINALIFLNCIYTGIYTVSKDTATQYPKIHVQICLLHAARNGKKLREKWRY